MKINQFAFEKLKINSIPEIKFLNLKRELQNSVAYGANLLTQNELDAISHRVLQLPPSIKIIALEIEDDIEERSAYLFFPLHLHSILFFFKNRLLLA